jgi:hypothetical protein
MLTGVLSADESWSLLGIFIVFLATHFIDANFLTPRIVGSQIKVNPMATLAAVIVGELTWGIAGMILFIPLVGIAKIVFLNLEPLKPAAFLMGDDQMEGDVTIFGNLRKRKQKKKIPSEKNSVDLILTGRRSQGENEDNYIHFRNPLFS